MRDIDVRGTVAAGFEEVRDEFVAALADDPAEPGAQLAAYVGDQLVVDLWAGDGVGGDSLTGVFSSGKGAVYLVAALLVQEGVLDLGQTVAHYWPEFATAGKGQVTVRELLSHQAGVIGVDGGFSPAELVEDQLIAKRLAAQRPYWTPGLAYGCHCFGIGALVGEVIRRATGRSVHELYDERLRAPLNLDLYLGLPERLEACYLPMRPWLATADQQAMLDVNWPAPESLAGIAYNLNATPPTDQVTFINSREARAGGQTSAAAVGNARGLARMYAAAMTGVDGHRPLLRANTLAEFGTLQTVGSDLVSGAPNRFALGFEKKANQYLFLSEGAFGHGGSAGSEAFADPASGVAYGYTRRRFAFFFSAVENARLAGAIVRCALR